MKKIISITICLFSCLECIIAQGILKYEPANANAGDEIVFTYQLPEEYPGVPHGLAVKYTGRRQSLFDVALTRNGNIYTGRVKTDTSMNLVVLSFQINGGWDNNADKGFFIPLYANGKIKKTACVNEAAFYSFYGSYRLGLKANYDAAVNCFEKEFELYPENKNTHFTSYLNILYKVDQQKAHSLAKEEIDRLLAKGLATREDYSSIQKIYSTLKDTAKGGFYKRMRLEKIPYDKYNEDDLTELLRQEKEVLVKENLLEKFNRERAKSNDTIEYTQLITILQKNLLNQYITDKNWKAFESIMHTLGWGNQFTYGQAYRKAMEDSTDWHFAAQFGKQAVYFSKRDWKNPPAPIPNTMTYREFVEDNKTGYGSNAYNYGLVLSKLKRYEEALPYTRDAAFLIGEGNNISYNSLYATIAAKTLPIKVYKPQLEKFVKEGKDDDNIISVLKTAFISQKKNKRDFDTYVTSLKNEGETKLIQSVGSRKIKEKSFSFTLKDIDGREVSLEDYKNKVLIIDFWATWCGPCIASFPAMHRLAKRYEQDSSVVFLYVNTFEHGDDPPGKVKDFMASNKYDFKPLIDINDKIVSAYGIESIPYRIIIGKDGYIQFRSLGFPGNEILEKELPIMINLAKK